MKFLVVGLGSIGKRHIKNLLKLKIKKQDIFGFDPREDRIKEARDIGILNFVKNLDKNLMELLFVLLPQCILIIQ